MFSGSVGFCVGSFRHLVLYYLLIPNRKINQRIGIFILMRGSGVKGMKALECGGSNGRIILGDKEVLVFCMGLLCLVLVYGGFLFHRRYK